MLTLNYCRHVCLFCLLCLLVCLFVLAFNFLWMIIYSETWSGIYKISFLFLKYVVEILFCRCSLTDTYFAYTICSIFSVYFQVQLPGGLSIPRRMYDRLSRSKMSIFAQELAVIIFGRDTLAKSSLTGRKTNKSALDPSKVNAIIGM